MTQTVTRAVLIPETINGHPSGNYDGSSLDWQSNPVKAANYYRAASLQSVVVNVDDFVGFLTIQGTHMQDVTSSVSAKYVPPGTEVWVDLATYGDQGDSVPITDYHYISILGNYTWIRVQVTNFTQGIIKQVQLFY